LKKPSVGCPFRCFALVCAAPFILLVGCSKPTPPAETTASLAPAPVVQPAPPQTYKVYFHKWESAEQKTCITRDTWTTLLSCDELDFDWPGSLWSKVRGTSEDSALGIEQIQASWYAVKFSRDPWPGQHKIHEPKAHPQLTVWLCSKDSKALTCTEKVKR